MKIDALTLPAAAAAADAGPKTTKDEFLRLLVAQLQHQDPLKPQDGTEFVSQLAQLAAVEQSAETNNLLSSLQATQAASVQSGYSTMVGRTITARITSFEAPIVSGEPELLARVGAAASSVDVRIIDASGHEVKKISLGPRAAGDVTIPWDGLDSSGKAVSPGTYRIEIVAKDPAGIAIDASALARGTVREVAFGPGGVEFSIGNLKIVPGDVVAITDPPAQSVAATSAAGGKELNNVHLELTDDRLERARGLWASNRYGR